VDQDLRLRRDLVKKEGYEVVYPTTTDGGDRVRFHHLHHQTKSTRRVYGY